MQIHLFSHADAWVEHVQSVIGRRFTHLSPEKISKELCLAIEQCAPECRLMFSANTETPSTNTLLRKLTYAAVHLHTMTSHEGMVTELTVLSAQLNARQDVSFAPALKSLTLDPSHNSIYAQWSERLLLVLRRAVECQGEQMLPNPLCWHKSGLKKMAADVCALFNSSLNVRVSPGQQLDLLAELMGFPNGFQQMKALMLGDAYNQTLPYIIRRALESLSSYLTLPENVVFSEHVQSLVFYVRQSIQLVIERDESAPVEITQLQQVHDQLVELRTYFLISNEESGANGSWLNRRVQSFQRSILLLTAILQPRLKVMTPARPDISPMAVMDAAATTAAIFGEHSSARDIVDSYSRGDDALQVVEELNRVHYWSLSRDDMDAFDDFINDIEERQSEAEQYWGMLFPMTPPYPIGTHLDKGVIDGVCQHTPGAYLVKKPMHDDNLHGYSRLIIRFEKAKLPKVGSEASLFA